MKNTDNLFTKIAQSTATWTGKPSAFLLSLLIVIVWIITGPMFKYSDTWQLVINTGTTIITFLMVFLIQNTQNRDTKAMHLKLDELLNSHKNAKNDFMEIEKLSDKELEHLRERLLRSSSSDTK